MANLTSKEIEYISQYTSYVERKPFIFSTELSNSQIAMKETNPEVYSSIYKKYGVSGYDDVVICLFNPTEMTINLRNRGAFEQYKHATVYHEWDGIAGKSFDALEVSFTFQSGNILPHWKESAKKRKSWVDRWKAYFKKGTAQETESSSGDYIMPPGVDMHQRFLSLIDQPKILDDGSFNRVTIETTSRLYPYLTMSGFFSPDGAGDFDQDAGEPNQFTWSASFMADIFTPSLDESTELLTSFRAALLDMTYQPSGKIASGGTYTQEEKDYLDALAESIFGTKGLPVANTWDYKKLEQLSGLLPGIEMGVGVQ